MGFIFIITPTIGWAWPALVPILAGAASALGYKHYAGSGVGERVQGDINDKLNSIRRVSVPLDDFVADVVADELENEQRMEFRRDDFLLVFRKDARGKFHIDVSGPRSCTTLDLRTRGEEFAREVVKKFAYHRMIEEIQRRGAEVVEETVKDDGAIVLKNRQWR